MIAPAPAPDRWLDAALAGRPAPALLIVIGLRGDTLEAIDRRGPQIRVLALEPDPAAAAEFAHRPDCRAWRASGRLTYLIDPDYAGADEAWKLIPASPEGHKLIVDPATAAGGPGAVRAVRAAKQIIFGAKANADARRRFAPGYLTGTLRNLPEIVNGHDIVGLTDFYKGVPAIIAGAGPSLDAAIEPLRALRDRAVVIAADTALRPLLNAGLAPQIVTAVDPQALNARHFHALDQCPQTWLVSEASVDSSVIAPFGRRTFWFRVADHHPWPWFHDIGVNVGRLEVWGSVLTAAFQVAVLAGCDPIVLAGADLAFTGGRPYARGTTYEFDWAYTTANGHSLDRAWHPFLKPDEQIRVPDLHGRETITSGYLQSFRDWLVARAQRSGRRIINATGAGIFYGDGIEQRTLADALPMPTVLPPLDAAARLPPTAQPPSVLAARLRDVRRTLARKPAVAPVDRWRDFAGEGFDPAAAEAAIDRAESALQAQAVGRARATVPTPWVDLTAGRAARRLLPVLPEAMTRWRAALAGHSFPTESTGRTGGAAAHDTLIDAFDMLSRLCSSESRNGELSSLVAIDQHPLGRAPLGAQLAWPQHAGWAVRLLEGALGSVAAEPAAKPVEGGFFSKTVSPRDHSARTSHRAKRSNADHACVALALEWMHGALTSTPSAKSPTLARWWRGLADAVERAAAEGDASALVLQADRGPAIELPLGSDDVHLARVLSGALAPLATHQAPASSELVRIAGKNRTVAISLRAGEGKVTPDGQPLPIVVPRVLSDECAERGMLPYATAGGAVVTAPGSDHSFLVREDGSTASFCKWPHPISGQLPFGDDGAVAWGAGGARYPHGGSGYVMWRERLSDEPSFLRLPFGPQAGTWWQGRLYWVCFPFGVGSWAPGQNATFALPDLTLFSVQDQAHSLRLAPRSRTITGAPERRLLKDAWLWTPGEQPLAEPAGRFGVCTSSTVSGRWTASAHPEADVIQLTQPDGSGFAMTCYYPLTAAWIGRSLLVATNDSDLLLFDDLAGVLDRLSPNPGGPR